MRSGSAVWVGVLLASLLAAGCAGQKAPPPTAADMLQKSLAAYATAKWVVMNGTVFGLNASYRITLNVDDQSNVTGSVIGPIGPIQVTRAGGKLYLLSPAYFQGRNIYPGIHWALSEPDALDGLIGPLADRKQFAASVAALAGTHVARRTGPSVEDAPTTELVSDLVTVTVPAAGGPPLRIATALDQQLSDGLADLKLDLRAVDNEVAATPPPGFVDLSVKNTLPAHFVVSSGGPTNNFHYDGCDSGGCTLSDLFSNAGGRLGTASATFSVQVGDNVLGTCKVDLPPIDSGGSERAGCRVDYDRNVNASGRVTVTNPN